MQRTPDDVKKGLECCGIGPSAHQPKCGECTYKFAIACSDELLKDTYEVVQQLEKDKAWAGEMSDMLREENKQLEAQNTELIEALTQLQQKDSLIKRLDQELVDAEQLAKRIYDKLVKAEERLEQFEGACEKWIKVEDQLPKVLTNVLVAVKDSLGIYETTIAFQGRGKWVLRDQEVRGTITHWMPLPEPPKEET